MNQDAAALVTRLGLEPHPEGGYFRETYRAELVLEAPPGFSGPRAACTAILFLLEDPDFSAFHRIRSDEIWHFYRGQELVIECIDPNGEHSQQGLGAENPQVVVKAGTWFGARLLKPGSYALVGCTVAPGFDFSDFEMANRRELTQQYTDHSELIRSLTHP